MKGPQHSPYMRHSFTPTLRKNCFTIHPLHIAGTKNEKLNPISIPMHGSWIFQGVLVSIDILLSSIIFISCLVINKNYLKEGHIEPSS